MTAVRVGAMPLLASVLLACASSPEPPATEPPDQGEPPAAVEVSGRVVVVGSDPFVLLVIVTEAGEEYELTGAPAADLWRLQQRHVTVRGRLVRPAYGPGFAAQLEVEEFTLKRAGGTEAAGR